GSGASLGQLCGVLETASGLMLLTSRRLTGVSEEASESEAAPWLGPPPELPLRRSWLGERIARGPLSFLGTARPVADAAPPSLAPVRPEELRAAMLAVLGRARPSLPTIAPKITRVSVEQSSTLILEELARRGT